MCSPPSNTEGTASTLFHGPSARSCDRRLWRRSTPLVLPEASVRLRVLPKDIGSNGLHNKAVSSGRERGLMTWPTRPTTVTLHRNTTRFKSDVPAINADKLKHNAADSQLKLSLS